MDESSISGAVIKLINLDQHATVCSALRKPEVEYNDAQETVSIDAKENVTTKAIGFFHQHLKTSVA